MHFQRRQLGLLGLGLGASQVIAPRAADAQPWQWLTERAEALGSDIRWLAEEPREEAAYLIGLQGYIYGYPLVLMDATRRVLTAAPYPNADGTAAPINQLARMPHYVSPDFRNVVRISLNSLWTTGWLDLGGEPIVLTVPDTGGRYYVVSVLDMWTNNFCSVGKRTTGTGAGSFLLAGPAWRGTVPQGIGQVFRSPTRYAWLAAQTQTDGEQEFAAVNALQARFALTPLSAWGRPYVPPEVPVDESVDTAATPGDQVARMDAGAFFARLARLMRENPPYAEDRVVLAALRLIGIEPGRAFDIRMSDGAVARGLQRAVHAVNEMMPEEVTKLPNVNGWATPMNLARYGRDYNTRAGAAFMGLGASLAEDTIYPTAFKDGDAALLDGNRRYVLRFEPGQLPPTNAVWSVSQYVGNYYARNRLNRYAIRPSMPLNRGADGSLEIYFQPDPPGEERDMNWLPVPANQAFNVTVRNYWPKPEALDGSYTTPPIRRIG